MITEEFINDPDESMFCEHGGANYDRGSFSDKVHRYFRNRDVRTQESDESTQVYLHYLLSSPMELYTWFSGLLREFEVHTELSFSSDSVEEIDGRIVGLWNEVGFILAQKIDPTKSEIFYQKLYSLLLGYQQNRNLRIKKGTPLHQLGWLHYYYIKDFAKSKRYTLLAYIEDIISQHSEPDIDAKALPAFNFLRNVFLVTDETLDKIFSIMNNLLESNTDSTLERYPESFLSSITADESSGVRSSDQPSSNSYLNDNYANYLLNNVRSARTNIEKKESLESLSKYLLSTVTGFEVRNNLTGPDTEIDLMIRNFDNKDLAEEFGKYIIVECKNWSIAIDAKVLRDFIGKIKSSSCKAGILFSRNGITGRNGNCGASRSIVKAFQRDDITIVIINLLDLQEVVDGEVDLNSLLLQKYEQVRFDLFEI